MSRCHLCGRLIWPWQRRGWLAGWVSWHGGCYRLALAAYRRAHPHAS